MYLETSNDAKSMVELGDKIRVGVYELTGYAIIENKTELRDE